VFESGRVRLVIYLLARPLQTRRTRLRDLNPCAASGERAEVLAGLPQPRAISSTRTDVKMVLVSERSFEPIGLSTLARLSAISREVMDGFFARNPRWAGYRERELCVVLAQGAALHYVDGTNGVKDFDCWTFFEFDERVGMFPPRGRRGEEDFGPSEFGRHPADGLSGRRVDICARSIGRASGVETISAVQDYLRHDHNRTPRLLAQKAMVVLDPPTRRGEVIWPP
jgi:hypothetical protein